MKYLHTTTIFFCMLCLQCTLQHAFADTTLTDGSFAERQDRPSNSSGHGIIYKSLLRTSNTSKGIGSAALIQPDATTAAEMEQEFIKLFGAQGYTYYGAVPNESGNNYAYKEFNFDSWTSVGAVAITEGPCKAFVTISSTNYFKSGPNYEDFQGENASYDAMTFFTSSSAQNVEFMYGYIAADIGKGNCNTWLLIFYKFD